MDTSPMINSTVNSSRRMAVTCRACGASSESDVHTLFEMMYGTRESFDYVDCSACGCLQIIETPNDLGRHYPPDYYSMLARKEQPDQSRLKTAMIRWYGRSAALRPFSKVERIVRAMLPVPLDYLEYGDMLERGRLTSHDARILDVGCGASPSRLAAIRRCGFSAVEGLDPFIQSDTEYYGIKVHKRAIEAHQGQYALIMFHHSLEHMADPCSALQSAARLLRPKGMCVVRVPITGTYFWRRFGVNWVELDAPRHLYIPTVESIRQLAERAGLHLEAYFFESYAWEIAASIRYEEGVPLVKNPKPTDGFSQAQLDEFASRVAELNKLNDSGRACFYLRAP